jgi:peroxiredoxin
VLISADPPATSARLRARLGVPPEWPLLCDETHAVADRFGIPISRRNPRSRSYVDGFIQPAVFVFAGEAELFSFVQRPSMVNLWGAARRPDPGEVLAAVRPALARRVSGM